MKFTLIGLEPDFKTRIQIPDLKTGLKLGFEKMGQLKCPRKVNLLCGHLLFLVFLTVSKDHQNAQLDLILVLLLRIFLCI